MSPYSYPSDEKMERNLTLTFVGWMIGFLFVVIVGVGFYLGGRP